MLAEFLILSLVSSEHGRFMSVGQMVLNVELCRTTQDQCLALKCQCQRVVLLNTQDLCEEAGLGANC